MARTKKDNFPIKLRQKPTTKGYSLYLEYNANGKTVKRYLGLHLLNGTTARIKAYNANIDKDVCFHVARHTFATTLLTLGGDLYTTSKLLGHSNISTTQIYAEIVEEKKRNAMALFDNL